VSPISVLGVHAGRVPAGTERLLAGATLVAAGGDQVALVPPGVPHVPLAADLAPALDAVEAHGGDACVLASGDPGFFGIVRALARRAGHDRLSVHPAPSSVAVAFARLAVPWDDALVISAHGRAPEAAVAAALRHGKVAILTAPAAPASLFVERLRGSGRRVAVAERLGTPEERVVAGTPEELADAAPFGEPNVVLVLDPAAPDGRTTLWPPRTPPAWGLPEDAFAHRSGMVTKAEVRAVALSRLGPGTGDLVWDVGCGSGSVAVECAMLGAAVVAIDHDADALALTRRNAAAHGVPVRAVAGRAPGALEVLPDPDAVFVGGGGADLDTIINLCAARARRVVVVTLATLERAGPALDRLAAAGLDTDGTLVQASRLRPIAGGHRLAAENPVLVLTGRRP